MSTNGTSVVQWAGGQEHLGGAQTMLVAARDFTAGQVVGTATGRTQRDTEIHVSRFVPARRYSHTGVH